MKVKGGTRLSLILASDNEKYGGNKQYDDKSVMELKKCCATIEINEFTGLMYEIL